MAVKPAGPLDPGNNYYSAQDHLLFSVVTPPATHLPARAALGLSPVAPRSHDIRQHYYRRSPCPGGSVFFGLGPSHERRPPAGRKVRHWSGPSTPATIGPLAPVT